MASSSLTELADMLMGGEDWSVPKGAFNETQLKEQMNVGEKKIRDLIRIAMKEGKLQRKMAKGPNDFHPRYYYWKV